MRVLVTGGGGFLGKAIVYKLLARNYAVRVLGRSLQEILAQQGVEVMQGNMADAQVVSRAIEGVDAVFHVAAKAGVWGSWDSYYEPNVVGTRNVINACKKHDVQYLIHTSTPSVVFNRNAFCGDDESLPYGSRWLCHYAHTKAIAEREALAADSLDGLRVVALRPHLIWGIGDPHIVPRIINSARAGKLAIVGDGKNRVDITHVENAAMAHVLALDALNKGSCGGRAYFISQGEPVVLWDWINELLERLGEPKVVRAVGLKKAYALGSLLEGVFRMLPISGEPPMTRFVALELGKDHYFNIAAARKDLGYSPTVSTAAGLDALVTHLKTSPF